MLWPTIMPDPRLQQEDVGYYVVISHKIVHHCQASVPAKPICCSILPSLVGALVAFKHEGKKKLGESRVMLKPRHKI